MDLVHDRSVVLGHLGGPPAVSTRCADGVATHLNHYRKAVVHQPFDRVRTVRLGTGQANAGTTSLMKSSSDFFFSSWESELSHQKLYSSTPRSS